MDKSLKLALNNYATIPHSLRADPVVNKEANSIRVGLASLYHHYYLDSHGITPPDPDPTRFEHVQFLLPTDDFRFSGSGLGDSSGLKRHRSNELGQAFCRWFLHDHLNITYFAHLEKHLNGPLHPAFAGFQVDRSAPGDTPDYFCATNTTRVFLAEAKGRYSSINFGSNRFENWRRQFDRVTFRDPAGVARKIKGHIVATRFATEQDSGRIQSGIWAEDPETPGEAPLDPESAAGLGQGIIARHYSGLAAKLGQPLLATALGNGVRLPEELRILAVAWSVVIGPLRGRRFIGGYFGSKEEPSITRDDGGRLVLHRSNPLRIDGATSTFFGIEESIFRQVVDTARTGARSVSQLATFEETDFFYSGFSALRDGSVLGPLDFFAPLETVNL